VMTLWFWRGHDGFLSFGGLTDRDKVMVTEQRLHEVLSRASCRIG
jgi:hypothetical protein